MRPSKVAYTFLCYNPIKYPVQTYASNYHIVALSKILSIYYCLRIIRGKWINKFNCLIYFYKSFNYFTCRT